MEFWPKVRRQKSSGVDGITPTVFNKNLDSNFAVIRQEIQKGYQFSKLVAHLIPKHDGKRHRIICVPTVKDRLVQRLLVSYLAGRAKKLGIINEISFGFVCGKEKGAAKARKRAIELRNLYPWAYKSDISSFFDNLPRKRLYKEVAKTLNTPSLNRLLDGAINCEIDDSDSAVQRVLNREGIKRGRGVRQGMPLSPVFANIILRDFDKVFIREKLHIVRYADDFIVLADSKKECIEIDILSRDILSKIGFEIPALGDLSGKTQICSPKESVEFLGLSLS